MTDLLIIWAWEFDTPFIKLLQAACERHGLSHHSISEADLKHLPNELSTGNLTARCVIDRAWDWGGEYAIHTDSVTQHVSHVLNAYAKVRESWNKPHMHYTLMSHGLRVPYLMILPSVDKEAEIAARDLQALGAQFSIKGAHSGGSGVLQPKSLWSNVLSARQDWRDDETLVQAWVTPRMLGNRRAWFRVFYACGSTFLCWADDRTHDQQIVTELDEARFHLDVLRGMAQQIATLCGLNLFSTEIALDEHNTWQVVDYVNDPCDFRPKSTAPNGVPDEVVQGIAERIARWAKRQQRDKQIFKVANATQ